MMKSFNDLNPMQRGSLTGKAIYLFLFILTPILFALSALIKAPLVDAFHEGEYLIAALSMHDYYSGVAAFPVLVHGAMDFIPALIAGRVGGPDHMIAWTRLLNFVAVGICWVVYMDLGRTVLRNHPQRLAMLGAFVALFFLMTNAADIDPVHRQQSFLGTRDIFLMLSLWSAIRAAACDRSVAIAGFHVLSGVFAAACLYWSYDRGLMAGIWLLMLSAGFIYQGKYKSAATLLLSYAAALFLVSGTGVAGSLGENLHNIGYWVKSSGDVWYISFKNKLQALPGALCLAAFAVLVLIIAAQWLLKNRSQHNAPYVLGLAVMQLVFLTKLYSLPLFPTGHYFIWPSIILVIMILPEQPWVRTLSTQLADFWRPATGGNKVLLAAFAALALSFFANPVVFSAMNVRNAIKIPADAELIDANRYSLDGLPTQDVSCILLWTNEGALSVLSKKRACTNYPYPVYISRAQEAAVLEQLKKNPPGLIVYDSPFWSTKIYGRDMKERLPAIDQFINDNYVFSENRSGYVFATPKQK